MNCGCKNFCETCGRDDIAVDINGDEFCNECACNGWSGELCTPDPTGVHISNPSCNDFERQFMCEHHAEIHRKECAEELGEKP